MRLKDELKVFTKLEWAVLGLSIFCFRIVLDEIGIVDIVAFLCAIVYGQLFSIVLIYLKYGPPNL